MGHSCKDIDTQVQAAHNEEKGSFYKRNRHHFISTISYASDPSWKMCHNSTGMFYDQEKKPKK